jgi:3-hydroxyisobutyrate dehydrogenase-like beta-hydroxyacid dehydrogenase
VKVGFIGTGNMGAAMALNLIRAGHDVIVYNRTREKAEPLAKVGARVADSPAGAARGCEVVITMLANDQALREIMFEGGQDAVIPGIENGAVHMSSSTISVALSKQLAEEHADRAQGYIAAPVLGRPDSAAEKKLWVVAAGPPQHIERCRPIMEAVGRGISIVGDQPWRANLVKLGVNFLLASMLEALGEAFALVQKSGVDEHQFLDIANGIFGSPVYANYGRIIADKKFEPAGFRLKLGLKDVNLALEAAGDSAVPMPFASVLRDRYLEAIAHGRGGADWSAIAEEAAKSAGL